jgi:hypothetical protein
MLTRSRLLAIGDCIEESTSEGTMRHKTSSTEKKCFQGRGLPVSASSGRGLFSICVRSRRCRGCVCRTCYRTIRFVYRGLVLLGRSVRHAFTILPLPILIHPVRPRLRLGVGLLLKTCKKVVCGCNNIHRAGHPSVSGIKDAFGGARTPKSAPLLKIPSTRPQRFCLVSLARKIAQSHVCFLDVRQRNVRGPLKFTGCTCNERRPVRRAELASE